MLFLEYIEFLFIINDEAVLHETEPAEQNIDMHIVLLIVNGVFHLGELCHRLYQPSVGDIISNVHRLVCLDFALEQTLRHASVVLFLCDYTSVTCNGNGQALEFQSWRIIILIGHELDETCRIR